MVRQRVGLQPEGGGPCRDHGRALARVSQPVGFRGADKAVRAYTLRPHQLNPADAAEFCKEIQLSCCRTIDALTQE